MDPNPYLAVSTTAPMNPDHLETAPETVLAPADHADEPWAEALQAGDPDRARALYLDDIRTGPTRTHPPTDMVGLSERWQDRDMTDRGNTDPEDAIEGRFTVVAGLEHEFENGIDWFHDPTADAEDVDFNREWQWQLNRHFWWVNYADRYAETGDAAWATAFEAELRDWIASCPRPAHRTEGSFPQAWRTIEAGIRAGWVWPYVFETFRRADGLDDETLWLWICSFRDHGRHLLRWPMGDNWKTMETNGLAHAGAMFPELDGAYGFYSTAVDRVIAELERQFYPDGLQTELAPGYAMVAIKNLYSALAIADERREKFPPIGGADIPPGSWDRFGGLIRAYGRLAAPDGRTPALHDSPRLMIAPIYEEYFDDVPPWTTTQSDLIEWGGYAVLRNEGRYGLLDAGPFGSSHQHQDTLQFVGHADGEWWPVDAGKPQYSDAAESEHIRSAAAHNVVLLDGQRHGVRPELHRVDTPVPVALAERDPIAVAAAERSFQTTGRRALRSEGRPREGNLPANAGTLFDHERLVCDVAAAGWVVVDRIAPRDDAPHGAEWLWHADGDWTVADGVATVDRGDASLRIESAGTTDSSASVAAAARDPLRGWGPTGESGAPDALPVLRIETAAAAGAVERVTLLSPSGAFIDDIDFGDASRELSLDTGVGTADFRVAGGDRFAHVAYEGPDGDIELSLDDHTLLASD
jgi:hypothetical protein